jgi:hypothetical protein
MGTPVAAAGPFDAMNDHIYCDSCRRIQPLIQERLPGSDTSGEFGTPLDLICGECRLVITTTYTKTDEAAATREAERLIESLRTASRRFAR